MAPGNNQIAIKSTVVIAVVDDDPAVCNSLKFSLEIEGFGVQLYYDAGEILRQAPLADYACLLIDYKLPGMNGLELLAKLRERQVGVPAIVITAKADGTLLQRAAAVGVPVLEKPFVGNVLIDTIRGALAAGC